MRTYTIRDVALEAGVGVSTVSRVLNGRPDVSEETRRRVLDVVAQYGYVQNGNARFLKSSKTEFAAIIVRGRRNAFLSNIAEQILEIVQDGRIPFLIEYIDEEADEFDAMRRLCAERCVGGFIILGSRLDERREAVRRLNVPCVFATVDASGSGLENASSVCIDDRAAACAMMDHLLDLGHRRIAVFGGNREGDDPFARRYQGVLDSLHAHGMDFDDSAYVVTRFSISGGYECAMRFFQTRPAVTAVMAMSDSVAAGAIRALYDMGLRVPQDVSVTGFDGTEMAQYHVPSIATVAQPMEQLARESIALLQEMLDGGAARCITVNSTLIRGESTAPVNPAPTAPRMPEGM